MVAVIITPLILEALKEQIRNFPKTLSANKAGTQTHTSLFKVQGSVYFTRSKGDRSCHVLSAASLSNRSHSSFPAGFKTGFLVLRMDYSDVIHIFLFIPFANRPMTVSL